LALTSTDNKAIRAALAKAPLPIVDGKLRELDEASHAVEIETCGDRASGNVFTCGQFRQEVDPVPTSVGYSEDFCELHNGNNAKAASRDLTKQVTKYYSLCALMRQASYCEGVVRRIVDFVMKRAVRLQGQAPPEAATAKNRELIDAIYELDSCYHLRVRKDGKVTKSLSLSDLEALLAVDNGDITSLNQIVHHCFDIATGRPCCSCEEETFERLIYCYISIFLGYGWPFPSVGKFTHTRIVQRKVILGFTVHGIIELMIETVDPGGDLPSALSFGAEMSDYAQLVKGRKSACYTYFILNVEVRWEVGIIMS